MKLAFDTINGLKHYRIPDDVASTMLQQAEAARQHSYPEPYKVGCIVLTAQGNYFAGVSYHTRIMSLTMHAEATAMAHAAIHGQTDIIAITGPNCGACKQLIWEHALESGIDIIVIMHSGDSIIQKPISTLMIDPWPANQRRQH